MQNCGWLFYYLHFERNYDVLKSKSPCFLLNKNMNFKVNMNFKIKARRNRKWKISHTVLEIWTLYFSSYKNCELKAKLSWAGPHERKKVHCCNVYFVWRKFSYVFWIIGSLQCILKYCFRDVFCINFCQITELIIMLVTIELS